MEGRDPQARFTTKDSGKRAQYSTGMVRDTRDGKARFDLIFPKLLPYKEQLITRFAELMARGAEKYTERNWEQARTEEELERYRDSAMRHLTQWLTGETDEDHAAAVIFNLMGAEYVKYRLAQEAKIETANSMLEHGIEQKPWLTIRGSEMPHVDGNRYPAHIAGTYRGTCPDCCD